MEYCDSIGGTLREDYVLKGSKKCLETGEIVGRGIEYIMVISNKEV